MTAPNMAAITASLERSLRNCSLNHTTPTGSGFSSSSDAPDNYSVSDDTALELNSNVSLPFQWEQCLDLKTGEVYYINWSTGMKVKEDPRNSAAEAEYSGGGGDYYYTDEEDGNSTGTKAKEDPRTYAAEAEYSGGGGGVDYYSDEDGDSTYGDSEESSSESSPATEHVRNDHVLVVAGCKGCLMYFMVPKQVQDCPKCAGQLLHFDRSDTAPSDP